MFPQYVEATAENPGIPRAAGHGALFVAFASLVISGILINAYLFSLLRKESDPPIATSAPWRTFWEFSPAIHGGFSWFQLAVCSLLSLFLELLMIRWVSSEIRIFAYFKNFVLIACFLGFGLGCYLCRRKVKVLLTVLPLIFMTLLIQFPSEGLHEAVKVLPNFLGASTGTQFWGVPPIEAFALLPVATVVIVCIFGLVAFAFIPMGQFVGWYLENAQNGILAYSVNVGASLLGIFIYTALCFWAQPPATWFLVAGILLLLLVRRLHRLTVIVALTFVFCIGMLKLKPPDNASVFWSPYQKLALIPHFVDGEVDGYVLKTNDVWFQQILNLSPSFVSKHPQLFRSIPAEWNTYNIPYHFHPEARSVLVLGSGMGNDVAAALRNGAQQVTAVEIDPLILELGHRFHPENPYSSPRVQVIKDDARSYVENGNNRFDLIVFSLLDSHTTTSNFTNIRIDNYVYTREGLAAAKRMLKPDGLFALVSEVFGNTPLQLEADPSEYTSGEKFFISGSDETIHQALSNPGLKVYVERHQNMRMQPTLVTTDNWPYFYQRAPGLSLPVVVISAVLVMICAGLVRHTGTGLRSIHWHFFFLGAGFMLLEAQIISKIALLFGTTWLVNSIGISGLLMLILFSNLLVSFKKNVSVTTTYCGLLATLLIAFFVPIPAILFRSLLLRVLAAGIILCSPVFFAGIVFIKSFARENFSGGALGSNLLGAVVGGMLESASMWTGIRSLLIIAATLYVASWLAMRWGETVGAPAEEVLGAGASV
jgi:hypothetical protein